MFPVMAGEIEIIYSSGLRPAIVKWGRHRSVQPHQGTYLISAFYIPGRLLRGQKTKLSKSRFKKRHIMANGRRSLP